MRYDVVVIGGGHAGCEAAAAAARMGAKVALVTMSRAVIGAMSCNPSIGGLGKGHLVREIDACDGLMARAADAAAIHYRMLNRSKGPAVQGPRVQADRKLYRAAIHAMLADLPALDIVEATVDRLLIEAGAVTGVGLAGGDALTAGATVIATGTFLDGRLHCGPVQQAGGRWGEPSSSVLAAQLRAMDLPMARLKTGTPPRLDGRTIDWGALEMQASDVEPWTMSAQTAGRVLPQLACALTRTMADTHRILREHLHESPVYSGAIEGQGPRYCPSIEDKVVRFPDRAAHQIFLEPEGLDDPVVYPNGISTSLPAAAQQRIVASIPGLERARITQHGYAVEYDHVDPRCLDSGLGVRGHPGLFMAGQINGTTGYEEAAAQGLVAGASAAAHAGGRAPMRFDRTTSYIGVMIDDLVLQGVTEPYRMLTARAEFRLRLRADNAATRLGDLAEAAGLLGSERRAMQRARMASRGAMMAMLSRQVGSEALRAAGADVAMDGTRQSLFDWLRLDQVTWRHVTAIEAALADCAPSLRDELLVDATYAPYLLRQEREVARAREDETLHLPLLDYRTVPSLSNEMVARLERARPATLGAASRIRGITPAALAALTVEARRAAR